MINYNEAEERDAHKPIAGPSTAAAAQFSSTSAANDSDDDNTTEFGLMNLEENNDTPPPSPPTPYTHIRELPVSSVEIRLNIRLLGMN